MVTISLENVQFLLPIKHRAIVEIIGKVINIYNVKIEIQVEIYIEDVNSKLKAATSIFTFAAINNAYKPIAIENKNHWKVLK